MAFAAGTASILIELFLIRYLPGQIRVLGYFTNFVLLGCFLGLGIGLLACRREPKAEKWAEYAPLALLALLALAEFGREAHVIPSSEQFLFLEYATPGRTIPLHPFLALSFCLIAAAMVPLGCAVATSLRGHKPLELYSRNLLGGMLGVGIFALLSGSGAPVWAWTLAAAAGTSVGLRESSIAWKVLGGFSMALTVGLAGWASRGSIWSPYQKISLGPVRVLADQGLVQEWRLPMLDAGQLASVRSLDENVGFTIRVNDDSYQTPLDLSDAAMARHPELAAMRNQYDLPFLSGKKGRSVLVLGAGAGNDVAGALRNGASSVDAVEIDPEILRLGRLHPEHPYADARVRVHLDDARHFLSRTDESFDKIVFGLLDSHVLMSSRSNVRLDSFVFTRESFALARAHLKPGGFVLVSHAVGSSWFSQRMRATLAAAFGKPPLTLTGKVSHPIGIVYAAGESVRSGEPLKDESGILTDDWPFPYLAERAIPYDYLAAMAFMVLFTAVAVRWAAGTGLKSFDWPMAVLGAAFLLLETHGLSVLSLLAGSTWGAGTAVFAGVLFMAWLSTQAAPGARAFGLRAAFMALFILLSINFFVPVSALTSIPAPFGLILGAFVISAPLFASGIIFAELLERSGSASTAVASNLIGALAGGLLENLSMAFGFRAMVIVAAALYATVYLFEKRTMSA